MQLSRTEPLAKDCRLACVKCPTLEQDNGEAAAHFFSELGWGKQLVVKIEYRVGNVHYVTLFDQENGPHPRPCPCRRPRLPPLPRHPPPPPPPPPGI